MNLQALAITDNLDIHNSIILKIKEIINYKNLEPGDKLPSERMLADKFEVSRSNIREAIQKLEFYGILKSIPQSHIVFFYACQSFFCSTLFLSQNTAPRIEGCILSVEVSWQKYSVDVLHAWNFEMY